MPDLQAALRPNLVDRVVTYFDPVRGATRMKARLGMALAGGYIGARGNRPATKEWAYGRGSANADILDDLETLRGRSRDLTRNAPIATGARNTVVTNVVGTGLRLQPQLDRDLLGLSDEDADRWERRTAHLWRVAAANLDITRMQDFAGLQALGLTSVLDSGDLLVIRRFRRRRGDLLGLKVQVVEADRVSNPNDRLDTDTLAGGVEVDGDGAPVRYWVRNRHPGDPFLPGIGDWTPVPAFSARTGERMSLLLFDRRRPGQVRGVPYLAPVIEPLKQLEQYSAAELTAAVLDSFFTVFVKTEAGEDVGGLAELDPNDPSEAGQLKLGSGLILDLAPGETIESADPRRPNSQFDPFVLAVLRQVGAALELPFEVLIKHFQSSYSAARAALLDAWKFFRSRRTWLSTSFCDPVYGWFLDEAVAAGLIDAPGYFDNPLVQAAWRGADWIGPAAGQIDPKKEVEAAQLRVDMGVSTLDREAAEITGSDFETLHAQRVKESRVRREAGLDVEHVAEKTVTVTTEEEPEDPDEADEREAREAA